MTFSPFYMGSHVNPYSADEDTRDLYPSSYQLNENWVFQVNFMVPLDREGLKQCKAIAKRQEEKMQLNYELVRIDNCTKFMQRGFTLLPGSRVYHLCSDVVPIQSLLKQKRKMLAILKPLVLTSLKSEKFKLFVVQLLEKLVEQSDNKLDDKALEIVKKGLGIQ